MQALRVVARLAHRALPRLNTKNNSPTIARATPHTTEPTSIPLSSTALIDQAQGVANAQCGYDSATRLRQRFVTPGAPSR